MWATSNCYRYSVSTNQCPHNPTYHIQQLFPKPTTTPGRQMGINFKLKATAGDCTQNKRGSEPNKFTQRLQVAVSLTWPYLFQLHSRSSFAYVMLVYIPFPATFSLAICLHVCDACIYHLLLHSRCHPRMQSHFLIHICHICDARTYHFPPRVGLAQARLIIKEEVTFHLTYQQNTDFSV